MTSRTTAPHETARKSSRVPRITALALCLAVVATGCIQVGEDDARDAGYSKQDVYVPWRDPAAVRRTSTAVNDIVYATRHKTSLFGSTCFNVPMQGVARDNGNYKFGLPHADALPVLPDWNVKNVVDSNDGCAYRNGALVWAPTVRQIGNQFVLRWTGSRATGGTCIGYATSPNAYGTFTPTESRICDPGGWSLLDPSLHILDGTPYLLYSRQNSGAACIDGPDSEIYIQQLDANGLQPVGSRTRLMRFSDIEDWGESDPACGAVVENPIMLPDSFNGYNLIVSVGAWTSNEYRTVTFACPSKTSCDLRDRARMLPFDRAAGGASSSEDTTAPIMYWHITDDAVFFGSPIRVYPLRSAPSTSVNWCGQFMFSC